MFLRQRHNLFTLTSLVSLFCMLPTHAVENDSTKHDDPSTSEIKLRIKAYVDGRDTLLIHTHALTWLRKDTDDLGRGEHATYVSEQVNGKKVLENFEWTPMWVNPNPKSAAPNIRTHSITWSKLPVEVEKKDMAVGIKTIAARSRIHVLQEPSEHNNYTTAIEFDDSRERGPDWYEAEIVFSPPGQKKNNSGRRHEILLIPEDCPPQD